MNRRIIASTLVLAATALVATACGGVGGGGAPSIKDARSCLKDAKFDVQGPQGADTGKVEEGVSATYGLKDSMLDPSKPLTIVVAAKVKKDSDVASFVKQSKSFSTQLNAQQKKSFGVSSGHSGKYVWVVAGNKSSNEFKASVDCVKS